MSTRRRPSSWSLVMAMMSSRNQASTTVLSAVVVSATTSRAHSACCRSTRSAVASLSNWLLTQPMSAPGVNRSISPLMWMSTILDLEATFCYLGDMLCSGGGCDSAIAARCCAAWGKFRTYLPVQTLHVLTTRHLRYPRLAYVASCTRPAFAWKA